jgi:hypothetical protein
MADAAILTHHREISKTRNGHHLGLLNAIVPQSPGAVRW